MPSVRQPRTLFGASSPGTTDGAYGPSAQTLKSLDSLQDDLDIQTMKFMEFTRKEQKEIFLHKVKELSSTEIVENAVHVGERIGHFHAKDKDDRTVRSSSLLSDGPLVVVFFRGDWCTYCNLALRSLQKVLPEIHAKGASLVAITPQSHRKLKRRQGKSSSSSSSSSSSAQSMDTQFPILCDEDNSIAKQFRIAYDLDPVIRKLYFDWGIDVSSFNEDGSHTLPLAATYVVDRDGTVLYSYVDCAPNKRAEPTEILNAIPNYQKSKRHGIRYIMRSKLRAIAAPLIKGRMRVH